MTQVVSAQPTPGTVVVQQTQAARDWNSGLFACFNDIGSCLMGLFCPCIHICNLSGRMGEGCVYGCCCANLAPFTLRAKLRTEHNIQGSLCNDAVVGVFCQACVLCQLDRELTAVGK